MVFTIRYDILFQEQVLKIARDLAGFTPGEGDLLRRSLRHKHTKEQLKHFHTRFIDGAQSRGVCAITANQIVSHVQGLQSSELALEHLQEVGRDMITADLAF